MQQSRRLVTCSLQIPTSLYSRYTVTVNVPQLLSYVNKPKYTGVYRTDLQRDQIYYYGKLLACRDTKAKPTQTRNRRSHMKQLAGQLYGQLLQNNASPAHFFGDVIGHLLSVHLRATGIIKLIMGT